MYQMLRYLLLIYLLSTFAMVHSYAQNHVLSLDGDGDYVKIVNNEGLNAINSQVTMEVWIKVKMFTGEWTFLIYKGDEPASNLSNRSYGLSLNRSGFLHLASAPSGKGQMYLNSPNGSIALNTWYHVAGVINAKSGVMKIFLNGAEVASGNFGKDIHVSALPLWIGWTHEAGHAAFAGQIDEVRIWNIARTEEEIAATMHTSLSGKEPGLIGYWQFEGQDEKVIDSTRSRHDGRLIGDAERILSELPTRVVKVVVTDAGGNPLSDATVFLEQEGKKIAEGKTSSSGRCHLSAYPAPGGYRIYAIHGKLGDWKSISLRQGERQTLSLTLEPAIPALIAALSDADDEVRRYAAWMLAEFGESAAAAVPALKKTLNDSNGKVRRYAVLALAKLNELPHETAPALIEEALAGESYAGESYEVRRDVIEALGRMDTPPTAAIPALTKALTDESYEIRRNAAGALAQIGSVATAAVPALIQTLSDENAGVREKAALALKCIGIPETMENIYELAERANDLLLVGILIAMGVVHLLHFLFYPKSVNNLYYAIWVGNIVLAIGLGVVFFPVPHGSALQRAIAIIGLGVGLSGLRFLYALFYTRLPKQFWCFLAVCIPLAVGLCLTPDTNNYSGLQALLVGLPLVFFILGVCVEMLRVLLMAIIRKKDGAWIIGIGFMAMIAAFVASGVYDSTARLRFLEEEVLEEAVTLASIGLLVSVSTYLARNFARTSKALEHELDDARQMQISLLPESAPPLEGFDIAGSSQPAREVGGDFFDYLSLGDGKLAIALADVSGKGLKGAMNAVLAAGILRDAAPMESSCGSILSRLNSHLHPLMERQMFTAFSLAILDHNAGVIQWSNAAQPLPLFKRNDAVSEAEVDGELPLGMAPDVKYPDYELELQPGDLVIFHTDGVIEAENEAEEIYGTERLLGLVTGIDSAVGAEDFIQAILQDVAQFAGSAEQYDDMTVVVLKKV